MGMHMKQRNGTNQNTSIQQGIRINKYLAECGLCSRRDADQMIAEGRVCVNGTPVLAGYRVTGQETITVNGKTIGGKTDKVVYAYYKPVGVICTERDPHAKNKLTDHVKLPVRVTYAGRLDQDSEGLLILTNDGEMINELMRGANRHEKEYVVKVNREIDDDFLKKMSSGIYLRELEQTTRPCRVEAIGKFTFRIVLTQGLNRQIRRMCRECHREVVSLKRVRINTLELGKLKPGEYRQLDAKECERLYASVRR